MENRNPYAPSRASLAAGPASAGDAGVWRDGKVLVMNVDATLPHRCVKCNEPAAEPMKRMTLTWHHPAIYLLLLLWVIVYVIVGGLTQKRLKVEVGLCAEHKRKRRNAIMIGLLGMFVVAPLVVLSGANTELQGLAALAGFLGFLCFLVYLMIGSRLVSAKKIDSQVARIADCGEPFLSSLPPYRG